MLTPDLVAGDVDIIYGMVLSRQIMDISSFYPDQAARVDPRQPISVKS